MNNKPWRFRNDNSFSFKLNIWGKACLYLQIKNKNLFFVLTFTVKQQTLEVNTLRAAITWEKNYGNIFVVFCERNVQIASFSVFFFFFWSTFFLNLAFSFSFAEQIFANNRVNRKNKVHKNFCRKCFYH